MNLSVNFFLSVLLAGLIGAFGLAVPAFGAENAGIAKRVVNSVTGDRAVGPRTVVTADEIYKDERISAAATSRAELELLDGSKIIVGEDSTIDLDRFVLGDNTIQSATINVAKGAFRFISGNAPKGAIKIKTPLSTIGIRGTVFDVYVSEGGVTRVVLISGQVTACTLAGSCITLRRSCDIVEIRGRNAIQQLDYLRSAARSRTDERALFTLTENQGRHSDRWRAFTGGCSARASNDTQRTGNAPDPAPQTPESESEGESEGL